MMALVQIFNTLEGKVPNFKTTWHELPTSDRDRIWMECKEHIQNALLESL